MKLSNLFAQKAPVFSFEIFPPKRTAPIETILDTLEQLKDLSPDFISVTYGASGSEADSQTCRIASTIKKKYGIESVAHLTCLNQTTAEMENSLQHLADAGIENILALRGDINPDNPPKHDFEHASDLIAFIKQHGDFHVSAACYPEAHMESADVIEDIRFLKLKEEAGASHFMSQLFFDNQQFYSFLERAKIAGIKVPIQAGIMPVVNKKQIERMVSLCGASLPAKFTKMMQRYEHSPEALCDAGIAYATDQIVDLISNGVDGIHLYTMNKPFVAQRIHHSIGSLLKA